MRARFLLALAFVLPIIGFAQSFNGNFETLQPNGIPIGWSVADQGAAAVTSDAHLGKKAIKAWVHNSYLAGVWHSNSGLEDANASEVSGYYKYLGDKKECDKASVSYLLGAKSPTGKIDTIAYGGTELKLVKDFEKFSFSVSATGGGEPQFMSIQVKPSGHCNPHGESNCCFLFVDDIILAGSTKLTAPAPEEAPAAEEKGKRKKGKSEEAPADSIAPTPDAEAPKRVGNDVPAEQPATENATEGDPSTEDPAKAEDPNGEPEAQPEEVPAVEEAPAEEESTEPVEEGWDSEEESTDDGNR